MPDTVTLKGKEDRTVFAGCSISMLYPEERPKFQKHQRNYSEIGMKRASATASLTGKESIDSRCSANPLVVNGEYTYRMI